MYPNKTEEEIELVGEHVPGFFHENIIQMEVLPREEDYTNARHQFVEEHAVSNGRMHDAADVIWRDTVAHFREQDFREEERKEGKEERLVFNLAYCIGTLCQ